MNNWHSTLCRKPDIVVVDGVPYCSNCDSTPDLASYSEVFQVPETEDSSTSPSSLNLRWPSSIKYTTYPQAELQVDSASDTSEVQAVPCKRARHSYNQQHHNKQPQGYCGFLSKYELRLLSLPKAPLNAPLHGQLDWTDLLDAPPFEALSYTWGGEDGNAEKSKLIYIGSLWLALPITVNCDEALRRLRAQRDLVIWVDAICINQSDLEERSHQVSIMREIYSKAWRVVMYLGSSSETSHRAMQALIKSGELQPDRVITDPAITTLFCRRYFSRVWVIQEVAMAQRLLMVCGKDELDRRWFNTLPLSFKLSQKMPQWLLKYAQTGVNKFSDPSDFVRLLNYTSVCSATDPRDHVFAIMGIVANAQAEGLIPDYSLSLQQTYTGLASYFILRHRQIELLAYPKTYHSAFPSWVPDWSVPRTKEYEPSGQGERDNYVSYQSRIRHVNDHRISLLKGQETISTICDLAEPDRESYSYRRPVKHALDLTTWLNGQDSIWAVYHLSQTGYPRVWHRRCYRSARNRHSRLCGVPRVEFDTGALHLLAWRIIDLQRGFTHLHSTTYTRDMSLTAGAGEVCWIVRTERPLKLETDLVVFIPGCPSYLHLRRSFETGEYTLLGLCDVGLRSITSDENPPESLSKIISKAQRHYDMDSNAVNPESNNNSQEFEAKDLDCKMMGVFWGINDILLDFMVNCLDSPVGNFLKSERNQVEDAPFDVILDANHTERLEMLGMSGIMWDSNAGWQVNTPQGQGIKTSDRRFKRVERLLDFWLDTDTWKIVGSIKVCMDKRAELETSWITWCQLGQDLNYHLDKLTDDYRFNSGPPNVQFQASQHCQQHSSSFNKDLNHAGNSKILTDGVENDGAIFRAGRERLREATYHLLLQLESWPSFRSQEYDYPHAQDKQEKKMSTQGHQLKQWFQEDLLVRPLYSQTLSVDNIWNIDRFTSHIKSNLSLCSSFESFWMHFHSKYESFRLLCQHLAAVKEFQGAISHLGEIAIR
jgi:hypothetical protein